MKNYKITWMETREVIIRAEDKEDALAHWVMDDYDKELETVVSSDSEFDIEPEEMPCQTQC